MEQSFEVHAYSIERLLEIFAEKSKASPLAVEAKLHATYFRDYFACIDARTILVECEYVDRDYLEDYSEYYVRCFREYPRKCARLHFFKFEFTHAQFESCLLGKSDELVPAALQESYLGFIVVKPLPRTIIGRTCLTTYPHEERRYFPATRCYVANLFGLQLKVEHTLAFQEQDSVVAACATSALWSIFQATGHLFQHQIPSPAAITNNATKILTSEQRSFPSPGLTPLEMAHAIKSVGLEPVSSNVANHYLLKAMIYAYLRAGIPMMFGVHWMDVSNSTVRHVGRHAVAITGYSLGHSSPESFENTGFLLAATRIDKIYAHDDQVGPFSRMVIDGKKIKLEGDRFVPSILTSWRGNDGVIGNGRAISDILLIPIYHKIRIPFSAVHDLVLSFDRLLKKVIAAIAPLLFPDVSQLEWDIYLISVNDLKREIANSTDVENCRMELLLQSLPRFLWRGSLMSASSKKLDLLFDATDIEQGAYFIRTIEHDTEFADNLRLLFGQDGIQMLCEPSPAWPIIEWFRR